MAISGSRKSRRRAATAVLLAGCLLGAGGCSSSHSDSPDAPQAQRHQGREANQQADGACGTGAALPPRQGAWLGVSIDWSHDTLPSYADRLGHDPAMAVTFAGMPMSAQDRRNVAGAVGQAEQVHSGLLLTLEPRAGLDAVTPRAVRRLAGDLRRYNAAGVPIIVRFAHEMNGSWYPWGQQPRRYIEAFRTVATAVHRSAPGSAMMWAPSYGGGYPFTGGQYAAAPGTADAGTLDTNDDGRLDRADDSYRPYYPGDRYVDWVGISLYHWGTAYPWGENEVPSSGKFVAELTGRYHGPGTDERVVPDFYGVYGRGHGKPVAISETAALYAPGAGGASEERIKSAWWRQVFAPDLLTRFPRLKLVDWFEWNKYEPEIGAHVDWTVTRKPETRSAFRRSLPAWVRYGHGCTS